MDRLTYFFVFVSNFCREGLFGVALKLLEGGSIACHKVAQLSAKGWLSFRQLVAQFSRQRATLSKPIMKSITKRLNVFKRTGMS
jgi:hypothetical protein